jgi:AbrB family looped-hinge helix DNA binding protein
MKNLNTVKIDSKGRMIIPFQLRDYLRLEEGTQMIITSNENKELRIIPLVGDTAYIEITIKDDVGALAKIIDVTSKHKVEILTSTSRTIERGKLGEWNAIIDTSSCDIKKLEKTLLSMKSVKSVKINSNL